MATAHSPVSQFEIHPLIPIKIGNFDLSFTNSSLWMVIAIACIALLFGLGAGRGQAVPGRLQALGEMAYEFIANLVRDNVGSEGRRYFPFIFTLFVFVLFSNLLGMIPYGFTVTSHVAVTLSLALVIFTGVTVIGFVKNGVGFLRLICPSGVPFPILLILVPIEILSYFVRPISLSMRLFLNMMVGHTLLKVFASFVIMLGLIGGLAPLVLVTVFVGFEFFVALLQAYIFTVLTCLYLNDAMHPHH